jgi:hypothetical protein
MRRGLRLRRVWLLRRMRARMATPMMAAMMVMVRMLVAAALPARVEKVARLAMGQSVVAAVAVGVVVAGLVERGARAARPGATSLLAMRRVLR